MGESIYTQKTEVDCSYPNESNIVDSAVPQLYRKNPVDQWASNNSLGQQSELWGLLNIHLVRSVFSVLLVVML